MNTNENIQSSAVQYLRFPLIIAVLFIHSYSSSLTIQGVEIGTSGSFQVYDTIRTLFSQVIARIAVPLFFFISGFLYFNNVTKWDSDQYKKKTKKRLHSLVIPYLFWNGLLILVYFIAQSIPSLSKLFSGEFPPVSSWGFTDFLNAFWNFDHTTLPILYPFWFIRDLIVITLLSPIVYIICKYLKLVGVVLLGICWMLNLFSVTGLSLACVFFFTAGAYLSINKVNLIDLFGKIFYPSFLLYPVIALVDLLTKNYEFNIYIHNIGILVGIAFLFNIVSSGLRNNKIQVNTFLSNASFFVFAIHEPLLTLIRKLILSKLPVYNDVTLLLAYFLPIIIVVGLLLTIYYVLNKTLPVFCGIITGGR